MEISRRGLFAVFAGAAASGKSIAATAKETIMSSRIQDAFYITNSLKNSGSIEADDNSSVGIKSPKSDLSYWQKKLSKLSKINSDQNQLFCNTNRRKLEVECLRSVSFSHKMRMQSNIDNEHSFKRQKIDIMKSMRNVMSGRRHWDDGDD